MTTTLVIPKLTAQELTAIRLILEQGYSAAYSQQLGASNVFARAEIQRLIPGIIEKLKKNVNMIHTLTQSLTPPKI
jgi:hypothetical protein